MASRRMKNCRYSGGLRKNRSSRQSEIPVTQEWDLGTGYHHTLINKVSAVE